MGDWVGKTLEDGLQAHLFASAPANLWTWLALFNLCCGLLFAAHVLGAARLGGAAKLGWTLLGFALPIVALLGYAWAGRRSAR